MRLEREILRKMYRSYCPEVLKRMILIRRRTPIWRRAGMIFIHVPKNGGTSINYAVYGQFMGHYTAAEVARWSPECYADLPSVAVLRNPWDRVLSAYRFARAGTAMSDGAQISRPRRYQSAAFSSFERFVHEWLAHSDLKREDNVFRPQSNFVLLPTGEVGVDFLGRLENPGDLQRHLAKILGRSVTIGTSNRTSGPGQYRQAYSPEMRDIVARVYATDVERFGYDF